MSLNIAILVVIYNRQPIDCETLKTINALQLEDDAELVIWNNGPTALEENSLNFIRNGMTRHLVNTLNNLPLSHIYNGFIETYQASKYIILDHDSSLTQEYFNDIIRYDAPLLLPIVTSSGRVCSPGKIPKGPYYTSKTKKVSAIASGLVLHRDLVNILNRRYGTPFDGHFAFYAIDTTFMLRMKQLKIMDKVRIISGFQHSLSRDEIENDTVKLFREKEMAFSTALILHHYPSWSSFRRFFRKFFDSLKGKNQYPVKDMFSCLFTGKHPKCR